MKVTLIASTMFHGPPRGVPWEPEETGGQDLAEYAGRSCYGSWSRPNPKTATNEDYLAHILEVGHLSVLEHGTATFDIAGVSRSLTHELVRHRHLSYSQRSQRYVDESSAEFIPPPAIVGDEELLRLFHAEMATVLAAYDGFASLLADNYPELKRKEIRQAARAVLPNATATSIVVTGNYRAWRHFITLRAHEAADTEIRALAVEILRQLKVEAPNPFQDFRIESLDDGTEVATTHVTAG